MSGEIVQLTAADFEDAMDFMNLVFSAHRPTDFPRLLPALYQPDDEAMGWNWAVRERGRIRAVVGSFPMQWQLGGTALKVAGIGGVSTHPRRRGAGYMRQLMQHCVARMRDEGVQLSWLGGQRQRYGYFGYEKCGLTCFYTLGRTNLRHTFGQGESGIGFRPLAAQDHTHLRGAMELHDAQPIRRQRPPARFYHLLCSWQHRPHIALAPDGRMLGYLVATQSGDLVTELVAVEEGQPDMAIARAWVAAQSGSSTRFELPPWHRLGPQLAQVAESVSLGASGNWQIFDWVATLGALLEVRARLAPLAEGCVVVEVEGQGRLALEVAADSARCRAARGEAAALQVDALTAHRLFCGPLPPAQVVALPATAALLEQWCPLPLFWARQDGV